MLNKCTSYNTVTRTYFIKKILKAERSNEYHCNRALTNSYKMAWLIRPLNYNRLYIYNIAYSYCTFIVFLE